MGKAAASFIRQNSMYEENRITKRGREPGGHSDILMFLSSCVLSRGFRAAAAGLVDRDTTRTSCLSFKV